MENGLFGFTVVFFFKQKTAYEMRISDWSSDVCSSDLTWKAARLGGASTSASNLQLNSQRLANQGREAVEGDREAFTAFKATKAEVDSDIAGLISNFGNTTGVSGPIATVSQTWAPLAKNAQDVIASEAAVLARAGNANHFPKGIPQMQAHLEERQSAGWGKG